MSFAGVASDPTTGSDVDCGGLSEPWSTNEDASSLCVVEKLSMGRGGRNCNYEADLPSGCAIIAMDGKRTA